MDFELTSEQQQVEQEIYDHLEELVTPELLEELAVYPEGGSVEDAPLFNQLIRQLGREGWLGIGWPKEYGGQGRSAIEQYMVMDAALGYYGIPIPILSLNTVGPAIMWHGTEEQKKRFLPGILAGERNVAIGYTEPEAGSDLASLKTKAAREGDDYVINGQKIFTTLAHFAHYIWLAARTNPDVPKHKGISIFMVDTNTPGVKIEPLYTMGGFRSNFTFFDDVRVPKDCLIGEENKGWKYITSQLAMERLSVVPHSRLRRTLEDMINWSKKNKIDGRAIIEQSWVRNLLADLAVDIEVNRLFNYRVAWQVTQGIEPYAEASMAKVFGSELINKVNGISLQIMGLMGGLMPGSDLAPDKGRVHRQFLSLTLQTFGAGANEVLRDLIAITGLGMPSSR
jgi:alkylation response protein AidB-like acyl-CoA dehydrogenase